ncbi:TPA: ATP-binding protein, partial [Aeromonas veronii]
ADQPDLLSLLDEAIKPSEHDKACEELQRQDAELRKQQEMDAAEIRASWMMLHREISEYTDNVFSDDHYKNMVWDLFRVMIITADDNNISGWNRPFLESHFGGIVTDRLRTLFMASWREHCPTLICERPEDQRSTYLEIWRLGLAGLYAEAEDTDWASPLTQEEVKLAARYSLLELNKLPDWINDLVRHHPSAVSEVFGKELEWILSTSTHELHHSMLLQRLHHAPNSVTMLFVPRLVTWLSEIDPLIDDELQSSDFMSRYSRVIELILIHGDVDHQAKLCLMAKEYISKELAEPVILIWLSTLIRLNPESGVDALEEKLRDIEPEPLSKAVVWFTKLFNERHDGINIRNNDFTPVLLLRLVRLAYLHIRRQDDAEHEGSYTPDMRDNAEYARNAILTALLESQGEEGWQVKHDMAIDPLFSHFKDRVLVLAQEAWAKEIDSALLDEQQCRELEDKGEVPLTTNVAMFTLLCDRLADLDELLNSDVSPREAWARIDQERIMRREIARALQYSANGLYKVDQEAVTAEEKETDIRLRSTASEYETVIELKLGDNRTARDLRDTIEFQLVRKYLSLETRRSGALLITLSKVRDWDHPDSGERIGLEELKELLDDEARRVEREMGGAASLIIHVLDLRPRLLTEKQSRTRAMKKRV